MRFFAVLKLCITLILLAGFFSVAQNRIDPDLGWHLRVGEWIVENKSVPHADMYSYTMPGFPCVDHEWLADAALRQLSAHNTWWVAVLLFTLFAFIPAAYWIYTARSHADLWMILLAALFLARVAGIRPQMISFFLFFILFELLRHMYGYEEHERRQSAVSRYAYILPLFFLLWANLHGGFIAGLGIWGIMLAAYGIDQWRRKGWRAAFSCMRIDAALFLTSAALTLVNPYDTELYKEIIAASLSQDTLAHINEWQPAFSSGALSIPLFLAGFLVLLFFNRAHHAVSPALLGAALAALAVFMRSVRNGPFFFVSAMPIAQKTAAAAVQTMRASRRNHPFGKKELAVFWTAGMFIYGALLVSFTRTALHAGSPYPEKAVEFLRAFPRADAREMRLFNPYGWGGYLIANAPGIPVFIDGRMPHWAYKDGTGAMKDYITITRDETGWQEPFQKYAINTVLLKNSEMPPVTLRAKLRESILRTAIGSRLAAALFGDDHTANLSAVLPAYGWELVYKDDIALVLVCPPANSPNCYGL